ncbi:UNVERIFIED_CONTAM: hypothetical protein HDU68_004364 [Siphonaria sp. JEL0065]|nr:hypothetical protein HDU68_004364 [Siphonaria sp. JEL0065]
MAGSKNKSGAQKRREAKIKEQIKAEQALIQQNMTPLTPAQAAALLIRQQQQKERLEKMESGALQQEQEELAKAAVGKKRRAPLLDSVRVNILRQDALLPNVSTALLEIFGRFDDDNDGALNRLELERFAVATNGEKFEEEAIDELKKSFNCNEEGNLTRAGFLEMYQLQTLSDPDETWRDLIKHGYSINIRLINRATGSADPNFAKQEVKAKEMAPTTLPKRSSPPASSTKDGITAKSTIETSSLEEQLSHAALVADLALTNKQLLASNLPAIPTASLTSISALLQHIRLLTTHVSKEIITAKQSTTSLKNQLKKVKSAVTLANHTSKDFELKEKEIKELTRKLVVTESQLSDSRKRCKDLETEIWVVRKDFLGSQSGSGVLMKKSSQNLRAAFQQSRPESRVGRGVRRESVSSPVCSSPAPVVVVMAPTVEVFDQELEGAEIARKAAEIARRHAASFSYDSSSMQTAQFAVGRATSLAESALASHSVAPSYASVAGISSASASAIPLGEKHTTTQESAIDDLVDEYSQVTVERAQSNGIRRSRRLAKPVVMTQEDADQLSGSNTLHQEEGRVEE